MARPSALEKDPGLAERIAQKVADWNDPSVAAQSEGVSRSTFYDWMAWGEDGREPYRTFSESIARAFAEAEVAAVNELRHPTEDRDGRTDKGRIQAAQFFLERARRERFGKTLEIRQRAEGEVANVLRRVCEELDPGIRPLILEAVARVCGVEASGGDGERPVH